MPARATLARTQIFEQFSIMQKVRCHTARAVIVEKYYVARNLRFKRIA
jgi:hypothetical protein